MIPVIFLMIMELAYLVVSMATYYFYEARGLVFTDMSFKIVTFLCFIVLEYEQLTKKPWAHPVFIGFCVLLELAIYGMCFPLFFLWPSRYVA